MKEIWKPIPGYIGLYDVSNLGNVMSLPGSHKSKNRFGEFTRKTKERILKPGSTGNYLNVTLSKDGVKKCKLVHRLVAEAFVENPDNKPQVNHKDGNGLNNKHTNLEWVTCSENVVHSMAIGLKKPLRGEQCSWSTFTKKKILRMKQLHSVGVSIKELSKLYDTNTSTVSRIISGKAWGHVKLSSK